MADDELKEMERYLRKQYQRAGKEVLETAEKYFKQFERLDKQKQSQVEDGKITEEEYQTWRKNKILYGEHWDRLLSQITGELYKTNQAASAYVEGKSVKIFAENFNLVEKEIPDTPVKGYTFELVNEETVRQLATTGELMLPPPNPPDKYKDNKWNAKQVHAEVLQGILQGDSMDKIAKRLQNTVDKNHTSAIRNARTMVTAAENSGRQAGFDKAEKDGIIFKKEWIATVGDGRTRESHLAINGELVDNGELFSNGCEFPGDWRADPSEVYNCRCTLGSRFVGFVKKKLEEAVKAQQEDASKSQFDRNDYSPEAKANAAKFDDRYEADKLHRPYLDSIWNTMTIDEMYAINQYTRGSNGYNIPLLGYNKKIEKDAFVGMLNSDWSQANGTKSVPREFREAGASHLANDQTDFKAAIINLTNAIEKSTLPQNTYLNRTTSIGGFAGMFNGGNLNYDDVIKLITDNNIDNMKAAFIGEPVQNHAFTSTGISKDVDFGGNFKYTIYAPKGTKAIYCEPQSNYGWTAMRKPYSPGMDTRDIGQEAEMLIQRGTVYKITDFRSSRSGEYEIDMEVVEQPDYFVVGDENTADKGQTHHT